MSSATPSPAPPDDVATHRPSRCEAPADWADDFPSQLASGARAPPDGGSDRLAEWIALQRARARLTGSSAPWRLADRYAMSETLGRGAHGIVVRGWDDRLRRDVAVKFVPWKNTSSRADAVLSEARVLAGLRHPSIVGVHDVGLLEIDLDDGEAVAYVVMERVAGVGLLAWAQDPARTPNEISTCFVALAEAIASAHEFGVIHRDLKPSNILVDVRGVPRILDFGLAAVHTLAPTDIERTHGNHDATEPTSGASEVPIGTPAYMAPEQHHGHSDARSDQYAFFVTLLECLTGTHPFPAGRDLLELLRAKQSFRGTTDPRVPRWLRRIIDRGLHPDPARRFASMAAVAHALRRASRRVISSVAALSGITAALAMSWWFTSSSAMQCRGGLLDRVTTTAERVDDRVETVVPGGVAITPALVEYGREFERIYVDACEAQDARWPLQRLCFDEAAATFERVVDLLEIPEVQDKPQSALGLLEYVDECGDPLSAAVRNPALPTAPADQHHLRELEFAAILEDQGRIEEAARRIDAVARSAEARNNRAVAVKLALARCKIELARRDVGRAHSRCREALDLAQAEGLAAATVKAALGVAHVHAYARERALADASLELARSTAEASKKTTLARFEVEIVSGSIAVSFGDTATAREKAIAALAAAESLPTQSRWRVGQAQALLAFSHDAEGCIDEAIATYTAALETLAEDPFAPWETTSVLRRNLASKLAQVGEFERAGMVLAPVLETLRRRDERSPLRSMAESLQTEILFDSGDLDAAWEIAKQLSSFAPHDERWLLASELWLANIELRQGMYASARQRLLGVRARYSDAPELDIVDRRRTILAETLQGELEEQTGDLAAAARHYEESIEIAKRAAVESFVNARAWTGRARIHARQGDLPAARDAATQALRILHQQGAAAGNFVEVWKVIGEVGRAELK